MKKVLAACVILLLCFVNAQTDSGGGTGGTESCAYLLEQAVPTDLPDLTSVETTMTIETLFEGGTFSSENYSMFDLTKRRVYAQTIIGGGETIIDDEAVTLGETVITTRYANGEVTVTTDNDELFGGEQLPTPPGLAGQLEAQLEQILDGGFTDPTQFIDYELISCDGQQSYGDVVQGEQVSVRLGENNLLPGMSDQVMRTVFDEAGQVKGSVVEVPEFGTQLVAFGKVETNDSGLTEGMTMYTYSWDGEQAEYAGTTTLNYTYNQPVDESLFE